MVFVKNVLELFLLFMYAFQVPQIDDAPKLRKYRFYFVLQ